MKYIVKDIGLYYPYTQIRDSRLLKGAMLVWDELEIIVPSPEFKLTSVSPDITRVIEETQFLRARPPELDQQTAARKKIIELFSGELPEWFLFQPNQYQEQRYLIYPEKLELETWNHLRDVGIACKIVLGSAEEMVLNRSVGLTLMTILAESYAGTTRELLTDVHDAQQVKAHVMAEAAGGTPTGSLRSEGAYLVDISLSGVLSDRIPIEALIAAHNNRTREMRDARAVYRTAVKSALERIKPESTRKDVEWIIEDFHQKMQDHQERLKSALQVQATQLIVGPVLGGLASLFGLLPATLLTVTGTIGAWLKFRVDRQKTLSESPASWLYYLERVF